MVWRFFNHVENVQKWSKTIQCNVVPAIFYKLLQMYYVRTFLRTLFHFIIFPQLRREGSIKDPYFMHPGSQSVTYQTHPVIFFKDLWYWDYFWETLFVDCTLLCCCWGILGKLMYLPGWPWGVLGTQGHQDLVWTRLSNNMLMKVAYIFSKK